MRLDIVTIFRYVTMMFTSRLRYYCCSCKAEGHRNESYRALKRQTPGYTDNCPHCLSDDVEVYDPKYATPGNEVESYGYQYN